MEDVVETLTRGNPGSVKTVLASVVLALAAYQVILAAIGYGKLRLMDPRPAFFTHRSSGDALVVIAAVVGLMCVAVYGFGEALHAAAGVALAVVLGLKILVIRRWHAASRFLPALGASVFVLLALTWLTAAPDFLAGED
jgi:hypothetical protein